ncbi:MAG: hypothetical protein VB098_10525 [Petrimonas sp.]|nr:hypothetical protein [Petrimonas sp.]
MKKSTLLLFTLLVSAVIFAQQSNLTDVVYLKNGSILRGIIIEQIPNESIKLQTADNNILVYKTDEIERITKEPVSNRNNFRNNDKRKGFIGPSLGVAFPVGDVSGMPIGATLSLIDFGYLFTQNIGIAGKWFSTRHAEDGESVGVGGLMAGPLVSTPISSKVNLEGRGLIGIGAFTEAGESSGAYFAYDLGVGVRINTSDKVSLLINADYINVDYTGEIDYNSVNVTFGVAFRLR